jgi:hypothetical protein
MKNAHRLKVAAAAGALTGAFTLGLIGASWMASWTPQISEWRNQWATESKTLADASGLSFLDFSSTSTAQPTRTVVVNNVALSVKYEVIPSTTGQRNPTLRIIEVAKVNSSGDCSICKDQSGGIGNGAGSHADSVVPQTVIDSHTQLEEYLSSVLFARMTNQRRDQIRIRRGSRDVNLDVQLENRGTDGTLVAVVTEAQCTNCSRQSIQLPANVRSLQHMALTIEQRLREQDRGQSSTRTEGARQDRENTTRLNRILVECREQHGRERSDRDRRDSYLTAESIRIIQRRARQTPAVSAERIFDELDLDGDNDIDSDGRSAELRCRVDKFNDIVSRGENIRDVTSAQAQRFLREHIRPHLLAALLDQSESGKEARTEAQNMIEDLQALPDRRYSGLRSIVSSLSSEAVRSAAWSIRDRQQQAILMERLSPGQGQLAQRLLLVEQQNLLDLHGRLANSNITGLQLGLAGENIGQTQAQALMRNYFTATQPVLACAILGFEQNQNCTLANGLGVTNEGTGLSIRLSDPRYGSQVVHPLNRGRRTAIRNSRGQIIAGPQGIVAPLPAIGSGFQTVQPGAPVRMGLTR